MKKVIEVREFNTPEGKEFQADQYPGPGLYRTIKGWFLAYSTGASMCAMQIGTGFNPPFPMEDYAEPKPETPPTGIQASDILKAIAISQNPSLAKELLK